MAVSRGERLGDALVAVVVAKSLRLHDAVTVRVETFARVAFGHQFGAHEVVELAEELGLVLHWIHEAVVRLRVDESCRVLVLVLERRRKRPENVSADHASAMLRRGHWCSVLLEMHTLAVQALRARARVSGRKAKPYTTVTRVVVKPVVHQFGGNASCSLETCC